MRFKIISEEAKAAVSHDEKQPPRIYGLSFLCRFTFFASFLGTQHTSFGDESLSENETDVVESVLSLYIAMQYLKEGSPQFP